MAVMLLKVAKIKKEAPGVISVIFKKPQGFSFYPGQYLDYELNSDTRAFTISASPTEGFLMLTTKTGQSEFKKALAHLKTGSEIKTSHPAGTFTLDKSSPAIFLAGGIGITPFRSMIKYAFDQKLKTKITLIYMNSDDNFVFKKELDKWRKKLNLTIVYHNSTKLGHLILNSKSIIHNPVFYLAGPPKMVDSFEKMLIDAGIDKTNIRYDQFDGY